jgi:hypothetical protein
MQQAMWTLHPVSCDLSSPTVFFHIMSSMAQFLENKFTENKMCVLTFLKLLYEAQAILRRTEQDTIKTVYLS